MAMIDLGATSRDSADGTAASTAAEDSWQGVPRRVGLNRAELSVVCELVDAPLPFEVVDPAPTSGLEGRLGASRSSLADEAYQSAIAGLGDARTSLEQRGLVADGELDAGIAGALGVLTTPEVALDVDVTIGTLRAHSWHRQKHEAVASLATVDGLVFELSWFPPEQWPNELARMAALPDDFTGHPSQVPDHLEIPYSLADTVLEALRTGRSDLVPVLTAGDTTLAGVLTGLASETRGRLRAIVAPVTPEATSPIGVVSWTLVSDGWRALRPQVAGEELHLVVSSVDPGDLAAELAPVLAEVSQ